MGNSAATSVSTETDNNKSGDTGVDSFVCLCVSPCDPITPLSIIPYSIVARCIADVVMNTEPRDVNGESHAFVKKLTIRVRVGGGSLRLDNLFNGDNTLGEVVNQTINQNFDIVSKDIIPMIERALEKHFKKTANKIMSRYTERQIFPS